MSHSYLNREQSTLHPSLWSAIDAAALDAAKGVLTGRRFLEVAGPYGLGLSSLACSVDSDTPGNTLDEATTVVSSTYSVPMLAKSCQLSTRRVAAHVDFNMPLDLVAVETAAEAVARSEEELIYFGIPDAGLPGLLTVEERQELTIGDWSDADAMFDGVLEAVGMLDNARFHGPYVLVLPPIYYNRLFKRYAGSPILPINHMRTLCEGGVFKAEVTSPVLLDQKAAKLMVGEDFKVGYSGTDGLYYNLFVSESLILHILDPKAICVFAKE